MKKIGLKNIGLDKIRMIGNKNFRFIVATILVMSVSACGFHLRGKVPLPEFLKIVQIKSSEHVILARLGDSILSSGGKLVTDGTQANVIIILNNPTKGRRVRSVSGQGRVREFTISYSIDVVVKNNKGKVVLVRRSIGSSRDFSFNETEVVGKAVEEAIIVTELEREVVVKILRYLRNTKQSEITPDDSDSVKK